MKKVLLIFGLLFSFTAFSQTSDDLVGTWFYKDVDNSDGDECSLNEYFEFRKDGSFVDRGVMHMEFSVEADKKFHAEFTFNGKGTWSLKDGVISYKMDAKSISIVNADENNMPGILKVMLYNPMKNEIKKQLKNRVPTSIVSYSGSKMILKDVGDPKATDDLFVRQ